MIKILTIFATFTTLLLANQFKPYKVISNELLQENIKAGLYASTDDVKKALKSKDTLVVDVRTKEEWSAAHIDGSIWIGREKAEKLLENYVVTDGKFTKDKLIVVCNTAHRASIEAMIFKKMGFKKVKVYSIFDWINGCNPLTTKYTKLGKFYLDKCIKELK